MKEPKFPMLLQIAILVRDTDTAIRHYEEKLGIGPWNTMELGGPNSPMQDLTVDGTPRKDLVCKLSFCRAYGVELELIEPIGESQYMDWMREKGPGIHHIAATLDKPYDEVLAEYTQETGSEPWVRGIAFDGLMDFSYLDYREEMGLMVECYKNLSPDKAGIPYPCQGEAPER